MFFPYSFLSDRFNYIKFFFIFIISPFIVLLNFDNCLLTEPNVADEFDLFACTQIDVGWLINFGISWEAENRFLNNEMSLKSIQLSGCFSVCCEVF